MDKKNGLRLYSRSFVAKVMAIDDISVKQNMHMLEKPH